MKQYFSLQYWKGQRLLLLAFLLVHVVVAAVHISYEGITVDEPDYYSYAAHWAHGNVERTDKMYDSKSPIVAVGLIPRIITQLLHPDYKATDYGVSDVKHGRYLMVVFTIIIACYLFAWIRKLFGAKAWILPVLFFLFDPLVVSFSMIITSDMATGACLIATMFHLFLFYRTRIRRQFILFSLWLGVSFVCKASLLFLLPCVVILYLILLSAGKIKFSLKKALGYGLLVSVITLSIINLAYFGKDSFHNLNQMHFESEAFQSLAEKPLVNNIPIPVPANYIVSLDLLQYHSEIGAGKPESSYPGVFVNGKLKHKGGFWYYYLFVGFYKLPISILILLFVAVTIFFIRFNAEGFFTKYVFVLWPAFFFFIILSCFNSMQLGIRHLLLIYPLFFIAIAAAIEYLRQFRFGSFLSWLLFGYMMLSFSIYFPDLIAYTNEFLYDKKNVFRKIRDASIDYGQNDNDIPFYLAQHPDTHIPPQTPKPGKYIVHTMQLFDEGPASVKPKYLWLLHFEPVSHYKYTMFIFDISQSDINELQQKSRQ
jgi:hypothetical protein